VIVEKTEFDPLTPLDPEVPPAPPPPTVTGYVCAVSCKPVGVAKGLAE
jgi:hypothetical protein